MTRYQRDSTPTPRLNDLTLGTFKHIPILNENNISYIKILSCLILC